MVFCYSAFCFIWNLAFLRLLAVSEGGSRIATWKKQCRTCLHQILSLRAIMKKNNLLKEKVCFYLTAHWNGKHWHEIVKL